MDRPGGLMADDEFPSDLLDAQRAYWEADARVREVTGGLPPGPEVAAGTAAITDGQRSELARAREARLLALEALNRHPWWATADDRHAAWTRLQKAARASEDAGARRE
ncbi:hypothetical protein GCM10017673_57980 [Streptosporangium violaceochromogenes]|nr:hypothetical protein GCM10017673_57980 [Streptosporangium violaceochromogenes]